MNITYQSKQPRDNLIQLNSNITYTRQNSSHSKEKQIHGNSRNKSKPKNQNQQPKIKNLHTIIDSLRYQNQSMNAMVKVKNQQIINLKNILKNQGFQITTNYQKLPIKQIYYVHNFKSITGQPPSINSTQLDRAVYQIRVITKQRDDLLKIIEQLEQQPQKNIISNQPTYISSARSYTSPAPAPPSIIPNQNTITNQQHSKIVQQYQQHIAAMASKLSTVHKLEIQLVNLQQQKNMILHEHEGMRNQLINRVGYCQHLENQIRRFEQEQRSLNYPPNQAKQIQNLLTKTSTLQQQIIKLNKNIKQKDEKLLSQQSQNNNCIQLTKQAFQSLQNNISTLQQKLNTTSEVQRKQTEKSTNLQIQFNKLNRQLIEKTKKLQLEGEQIKKLENEKIQLHTTIKKIKNQTKLVQKKLQDKTLHSDKLLIDLQKKQKHEQSLKQCMLELEAQRKKLKQSDQLLKKLIQKISKFQQTSKHHLKQSTKSIHLIQQYKHALQNNQKKLQQQNQIINKLHEKNNRRLDQLDINIKNNINLQDKLRQISQRHQSLTDEIQQYIKINYYIKSTNQ